MKLKLEDRVKSPEREELAALTQPVIELDKAFAATDPMVDLDLSRERNFDFKAYLKQREHLQQQLVSYMAGLPAVARASDVVGATVTLEKLGIGYHEEVYQKMLMVDRITRYHHNSNTASPDFYFATSAGIKKRSLLAIKMRQRVQLIDVVVIDRLPIQYGNIDTPRKYVQEMLKIVPIVAELPRQGVKRGQY